MGELFLKILNMSIGASWLILAVILFRFALKKTPKRIAVFLWGIAVCAMVTACFAANPKQNISQEQHTVQVRITEVEHGSFLAAPVEGSWELSSSDLFRVSITNMPPSPEPQVGDIVEITYDGSILESYPAQFGTIYSMSVVLPENPLEIEEQPESVSAGYTGGADTPDAVESEVTEPEITAPTLSEKQTAIRQAIMTHNQSSYAQEYDAACCSFIPLETLSGTALAGSSTHKIIYYGWALYMEYKVTDICLEPLRVSHIPVALSFTLDEGGYTLTEYWEPREGGDYAQDIREKFPAHIAEDGMDSQKFVLRQIQECYTQAVASTGLDTDLVIGTLIETICSSPALSSNPKNSINERSSEYRELTYYGQHTLNYCFARFEEGGETGLAGQIMMQLCKDIAAGWGEEPIVFSLPVNEVLTGQMWYSAFKNNALNLMKQYTKIELAERYPASYLLLGMLGEV